ncbi:MAG: Nif3-like dinuclear metal center hexameric protein [Alkalispirochaeta sp.]
MTLAQFDEHIRRVLPLEEYAGIDGSKNGLQVDRQNQEIRHVALAVDAAQETFERAAEIGADLIFVHHGLFWGREQVLTGDHYRRVRFLFDHDIALYAVHLPLDAHLSLGNNAGMAEALQLGEVEPFGLVKGMPIGVAGHFPHPVTVDHVVNTLFGEKYTPLAVLKFGPSQVRSVGIISGGAPLEVDQAIEQGLDLYITGDANHIAYHRCRESGINAIFGGHYATEVWGVQRVGEMLANEAGLAVTFLDVPTGL